MLSLLTRGGLPVVVDRTMVQCPADLGNPCLSLSTELRHYVIKAEDTIDVCLYRINLI